MTELFAAFAAIMSLVNFVALACISYNLTHGYYPRIQRSTCSSPPTKGD